MTYSNPTNQNAYSKYTGWLNLKEPTQDSPNQSIVFEYQCDTSHPDLNELQKDAAFQAFIDYLELYPGAFPGYNDSPAAYGVKRWEGSSDCSPTTSE